MLHNCPPEEMVYNAIRRSAVDLSVAFHIKHIGSSASGIVDIAATTGDMTFKVGALGSEVADTTVGPALAVPGTINLSSEAATFKLIDTLVTASANWEFWFKAALPGDATEAGGTAKIINNITGADCTPADGYAVLIDTSTALYHAIGVTNNGPSSEPHGSDAGVYNQIQLLKATSTYISGTSVINVYEVDDVKQTSTLLFTIAAGATTVQAKFPDDGNPSVFVSTRGKRLVVKLVNSAAMTVADMVVYYGQYVYGPSARANRLMSAY